MHVSNNITSSKEELLTFVDRLSSKLTAEEKKPIIEQSTGKNYLLA